MHSVEEVSGIVPQYAKTRLTLAERRILPLRMTLKERTDRKPGTQRNSAI